MPRILTDRKSSRVNRYRGFTLVELVVTMLIAAILTAIAVPAYSSYVRKARRTEAKSALLDMASLEERYFATQNTYTTNFTDLGYSSATSPMTVGNGYYQVTFPVVTLVTLPSATSAGIPASFTITAVPYGDQTKDTLCSSFMITSGGAQSATGTDPNPSVDCWR